MKKQCCKVVLSFDSFAQFEFRVSEKKKKNTYSIYFNYIDLNDFTCFY